MWSGGRRSRPSLTEPAWYTWTNLKRYSSVVYWWCESIPRSHVVYENQFLNTVLLFLCACRTGTLPIQHTNPCCTFDLHEQKMFGLFFSFPWPFPSVFWPFFNPKGGEESATKGNNFGRSFQLLILLPRNLWMPQNWAPLEDTKLILYSPHLVQLKSQTRKRQCQLY